MGMYNTPKARASKELEVLVVPDQIIPDASAAQLRVGAGNLCRIKGTAGGFVMFQKAGDTTAASVTSKETLETEAGFFIVVAPAGLDFIRTSVAMRIEVTKD